MSKKFTSMAVVLGGLAIAGFSGSAFSGEAVSNSAKKVNKLDVFSSDTSISLFAPDIGIVTKDEMAAIKKNLFINVLKADIKKNSENKG
ncbi:MAG: hypothetical protein ACRBBN_10920 [Methyloligellaceae bacterium]